MGGSQYHAQPENEGFMHWITRTIQHGDRRYSRRFTWIPRYNNNTTWWLESVWILEEYNYCVGCWISEDISKEYDKNKEIR
jgi:hypothetical protein